MAVLHWHTTGLYRREKDPPPPALHVTYSFPRGYGSLWILAGTSRLWPRVEEAREAGLLGDGLAYGVTLEEAPGRPEDGMDYIANNVLGALLARLDKQARSKPITGGGSLL